jgi:hypothetical protein
VRGALTLAFLAGTALAALPARSQSQPPAPPTAATGAPTTGAPLNQASPSPAASAAPVATALPFRFIYRATPAPGTTPFPGPNAPQISEIDLSDSTIVTPGEIRVRVLTSDPVVSVTAETFGRTIPIPEAGRGVFLLDGYVPAVPEFLRNRSYDVNFTASVSDGRSTSVTLPLILK